MTRCYNGWIVAVSWITSKFNCTNSAIFLEKWITVAGKIVTVVRVETSTYYIAARSRS